MKHKICRTCKEIEEINFYNKFKEDSQGELVEILKAQLVTNLYDMRGQQRGHMGYRARALNFCPECGKKIDPSKKKWRI